MLSNNAKAILEKRYLLKNSDGNIIETPEQMFERVASAVATGYISDFKYGLDNEFYELTKNRFKYIMMNCDFMPASPTLMNAGTEKQMLSSCFGFLVGDSLEEICDLIKDSALVQKAGGGVGLSLSNIRPKGDKVGNNYGVANGPIGVMSIFNKLSQEILQGGKRRGAWMASMNVHHPDILRFIRCKRSENAFTNFNISVEITDEFMKAVKDDAKYNLINPRTNKTVKQVKARTVFNSIARYAHASGEPGVIFIDTANKTDCLPTNGKICTSNPCGEFLWSDSGACNLGSINISNHVINGKLDKSKLQKTTFLAIMFLDSVITINEYPTKKIKENALLDRPIGLGVMGIADAFIKLGIRYDSKEALDMIDEIMEIITTNARAMSENIAFFKGRNKNRMLTSIAPTGTIAMISGTSYGIEPLFAPAYIKKNILGGITNDSELLCVHPLFEKYMKKYGLYDEDIVKKAVQDMSIQNIDSIPDELKNIFRYAHDISPEWHIQIQAQFQKWVDNAVSKTVNLPHDATVDNISDIYMQAWKTGCKGVTVYRNASRKTEVINKVDDTYFIEYCPECEEELIKEGKCSSCICGYSTCSI